MDEQTHTALLASIEKWKRNREVHLEEGSVGASKCPLCRLFHPIYDGDQQTHCCGCPVAEHTGAPYCRSTPYRRAANARTQLAWEEACEDEIAFLKSLLQEQPK